MDSEATRIEGPKSLLIIDLPNSVREDIAAGFSAIGWKVTVAQSVAEARLLVVSSSPSLLLVEAVLDGISSFPFIAEVTLLIPATPVVVLTSRGSIPLAVRAVRSGAIALLLKPAGVSQILEACADLP